MLKGIIINLNRPNVVIIVVPKVLLYDLKRNGCISGKVNTNYKMLCHCHCRCISAKKCIYQEL